MSHFTRIKTNLVEKKYILAALDDMEISYKIGEKIKGFGEQSTQVDIQINFSLFKQIGLKLNSGKYEIVADWYGVSTHKRNQFIQNLSQRYAYHATKEKMEEQGFELIEETNHDGEIRLLLRRMS
ncbi:MAG: hypothetical protein CVU39_03560 [Chloroflexi bacterium HGW-Chloroflexi-10]|jgi:hypothetical protein|nr:MAG: hypothetical protein CVU39_03560 [Chloroflexi bacterium HGW-Chloroflexi-10]